jgi:hypothetical protein
LQGAVRFQFQLLWLAGARKTTPDIAEPDP